MVFSNTIIFLGEAERLSPSMGRPMISKPSLGTFSISILPMAPTKRNWAPGNLIFSALAMATAGKICPPVPPPLKINLVEFWTGVVFLVAFDMPMLFYTPAVRVSSCCCFSSCTYLEIPRMIPKPMLFMNRLVPPILTRGIVRPVTGSIPTATPILTKA